MQEEEGGKGEKEEFTQRKNDNEGVKEEKSQGRKSSQRKNKDEGSEGVKEGKEEKRWGVQCKVN